MADRAALKVNLQRRVVCLCVCAWLGLSGGVAFGQASELRKSAVVKAVERARPAVVNIRGEKTVAAVEGQADAARRVNGMGTGVIIDERGYIVTNHHVVDGVREIQVTLESGERHIARLIQRDPKTDLAIIKIDSPKPLPTIPIGTSSDLMPGESVVAVGNAYGYEHTVTRGIVSALHRAVQVNDAQFYDDLIQTDAAINPGNSGGPLLNIDGDMIGINVAVRAGAQGIGFAIPVDKVLEVTADLLADYNTTQNWLGVAISTNPRANGQGLVVTSVDANSPASKSGIQSGDILSSLGDQQLHRALDFQRALLDRKAGDEITLTGKRGDETLTLKLTLNQPAATPSTGNRPLWEVLGLDLKPIPQEEFQRRFQTKYRGGLTVLDVRPDSAAAAQGIHPGDVLVGMHIWETVSLENVAYIVNRPDFASINPVKFFILRGNETLYGYLSVNAKGSVRR